MSFKRTTKEEKEKLKPSKYHVTDKTLGWSPLRKYPPNEPCICGSGKKFKKCCRDKTMKAVEKSLIPKLRETVKEAKKKRE